MANIYLTGFNNQFIEFIDDVKLCFKDNSDVMIAYSILKKMRNANPKIIINLWNKKVFKYKKQIEDGDLNFFIEHNYSNDINNIEIINRINKIRNNVRELSDENKDKIKLYLKNLSKLADLYFIN